LYNRRQWHSWTRHSSPASNGSNQTSRKLCRRPATSLCGDLLGCTARCGSGKLCARSSGQYLANAGDSRSRGTGSLRHHTATQPDHASAATDRASRRLQHTLCGCLGFWDANAG
jgi:hypothetical protein